MSKFIRKWRNRLARFIHDPGEGHHLICRGLVDNNPKLFTFERNMDFVTKQLIDNITSYLIQENFIKITVNQREDMDAMEVRASFNIINKDNTTT